MDQHNMSRMSSNEEDEEDLEHPPSTKMGFYETVARENTSATNRKAFRLSSDKPTRENMLEMQVEHSTNETTLHRSTGVKLPPITNSSVIANSS